MPHAIAQPALFAPDPAASQARPACRRRGTAAATPCARKATRTAPTCHPAPHCCTCAAPSLPRLPARTPRAPCPGSGRCRGAREEADGDDRRGPARRTTESRAASDAQPPARPLALGCCGQSNWQGQRPSNARGRCSRHAEPAGCPLCRTQQQLQQEPRELRHPRLAQQAHACTWNQSGSCAPSGRRTPGTAPAARQAGRPGRVG